jgi:uncharacterized protein
MAWIERLIWACSEGEALTLPVMERRAAYLVSAGVGLLAGLMSGALGVGGGVVMVPALVLAAGLSQHQAHATSLAAVVPIASAGAATFAWGGSLELAPALALAAGAVIGAPLGARVMSSLPERSLKVVFGVLMVVMGVYMVWP